MVMVMRLVITPVGQAVSAAVASAAVASATVASTTTGPLTAAGMLQLWGW